MGERALKIIYIASSSIPSRWANSVQVMNMCQAFSQHGHQVTLIARKGTMCHEDDYVYYGVQNTFAIKKLPWPAVKGGGVIYGWHCRRFLFQTFEPDLVYARCIYGIIGALKLGLPCIYEVHTPPHSRIHYLLERAVLRARSFEHLVVISNALKKEYMRLYPWLEDRQIIVAPDGADLPPSAKQLDPVPNWTGREGVLQIGYVGHLFSGRGMEIIARLAPLLPHMDFHVIGGTEDDIRHWSARANFNNLYFHGFVPPHETIRYRAMCDILLLPYQPRVALAGGRGDNSKWMSPLKMFEYMASHKAIIASKLPAIEEVLTNGRNTLLVPPDDVGAWSEALKKLAECKELRNRLAEHAYEDAAMCYTWTQRAKRVLCNVGQ